VLNIQDIAFRIEQPATLSVQDINDLRDMTENFPYAQIFPILYLKALSNRKDVRFDEELTKYAYRISDRIQLFELIHSKEETIILQTHDLSTETEINTSSDEENLLELIVQETNSELPKVVEQELISPNLIAEEIEEDNLQQHLKKKRKLLQKMKICLKKSCCQRLLLQVIIWITLFQKLIVIKQKFKLKI